ncbi:hypothetical protein IFM89_000916 [Coptis chinensis]|uniref:Protein root UVB sensitive/RUS domain-containing protein n=1 Tax=Coptis chinensis TaxID=261450 RepID=A0A835MC33_9MAGN|nr:hypothetical protein IFM89_000916 [Coptis chinensis]
MTAQHSTIDHTNHMGGEILYDSIIIISRVVSFSGVGGLKYYQSEGRVFDFHSVQFEHWYRVADSIFPRYFSLLATVANIAKQVSLACYLATSSAVHRSFAEKDNLGALSAKSQTQSVCFDSLGLVLATLLNILCKNNQRLQAGLPLDSSYIPSFLCN